MTALAVSLGNLLGREHELALPPFSHRFLARLLISQPPFLPALFSLTWRILTILP